MSSSVTSPNKTIQRTPDGAAARTLGEMRLPLLASLILISFAAHAEVDPMMDLIKGQPKDVAAVAGRIVMCTHFASEEPYDGARRKEISVAMKKYRCEKVDKDEAALRKRYKDDSVVLDVLQKAHEW